MAKAWSAPAGRPGISKVPGHELQSDEQLMGHHVISEPGYGHGNCHGYSYGYSHDGMVAVAETECGTCVLLLQSPD